MNWLKLFYQLFLLVTLYRGCQSKNKVMAVRELRITSSASGNFVFSNEVLVKPDENVEEYTFLIHETVVTMLGGKFKSEDIEITHALDVALEFMLIRPSANFIIYCQFLSNMDLQLFFSELRKPLPLRDGHGISIRKLFQFSPNSVLELANDSFLYRKIIPKSEEVGAARSFNFVRLYSLSNPRRGVQMLIQEVDLVILSRAFNITSLIGEDKFGLCVQRAPENSVFILRLRNREQALLFFSTLTQDANSDIPCVLDNEWLDSQLPYIDSHEPFVLSHLPYLKRFM